ncbi:molybdopterin converting factor subunit 1 (plasmid) [Priestia megaterium NCT-2]|uniref:molybdopterin converting factor subunit 1 n=1 Tax=Priestia megaterium TaxID=1404 RepID=UPI000EB75CA2|nr:molybdopterin converting factor subunit 1 [Priestia megaterium]AYE53766.1 molybdopterin converting factor subunit 1 [Priestia megaterium NCT-2]
MITILLFAHLQEQLGTDTMIINKVELTVAELKEKVEEELGWDQSQPLMVAINEEYAIDEDLIKEGDIVALIPPVSGG